MEAIKRRLPAWSGHLSSAILSSNRVCVCVCVCVRARAVGSIFIHHVSTFHYLTSTNFLGFSKQAKNRSNSFEIIRSFRMISASLLAASRFWTHQISLISPFLPKRPSLKTVFKFRLTILKQEVKVIWQKRLTGGPFPG